MELIVLNFFLQKGGVENLKYVYFLHLFFQSEVMYNKFPLLLPYPVQDHNGCISLFGLLVDLAVQCLYRQDLTKGLVSLTAWQ